MADAQAEALKNAPSATPTLPTQEKILKESTKAEAGLASARSKMEDSSHPSDNGFNAAEGQPTYKTDQELMKHIR